MREIKFRVWANTDDGMKMIYLNEVVCDNGLWFSSNTHIDDYAEAVMQFTGLQDKNGKEIYEGDILKDVFEMGFPQVVVYEEDRFFVRGMGIRVSSFAAPQQIEIIGNIYESKNDKQ